MASRPPPPPASAPPQSTVHGAPLLPQPLDLQPQLHVHVPPLPSPNTTAAAAALFRVNQLPMAVLSPSPTGPFSFDKADVQRSGRSHRALATIDEHAQHEPADARCSDAARRDEDAAGEAYAAAVQQQQQHQQQQEDDRRAKSRSVFTDAAAPLLPLSLYATPGSRPPSSAAAENAMLPPELPMSPASGDVRKRNVGVPKFLRFLFQMLEYEDRSVICWSHKGTAFQIREPEELARSILPKYFKHNKVSSFQRQLNYFGFKKWTKTQTNICTFSHPFFIRGEKEKMRLIKRKERAARAAAADDAKADAISAAAAEILAGDDDSHPQQQQPRDEPVASTRPSAKRPRTASSSASSSASVAGRSPRGDGRVKGTTPRAKKEPAARRAQSTVAARKRGKTAGLASLEASPPSMGKMTLPAISPSSSSSSTWGSSASTAGARGLAAGGGDDGPIGADAFGRFPRDAAAPSNGSVAAYSMVDAAPVMPIHASLLLSHQQAQQQQSSLARRLSGGVYDSMSMSDFVNADWSPPQPSAEDAAACPSTGKDSMMMLSAFKYGDSSSISAAIGLQPSAFDMMEAQGHVFSSQSQAAAHAGGSAASSGSKDYLDMLLESAAMDEQLSVAAATASDVASWDASYAIPSR
ncbi:hypothetical protein P43SY_009555 [Pythium insidiosum]|uniref:HSF-type DNA-binding domain-containing protein n=1 Tax=Pythium insidiosum TaxID=114742 RepID=A0AAD5LJ62_PYTIN|nr:hypothetical protein P43SY_009555 [Pythium insidiosum]